MGVLYSNEIEKSIIAGIIQNGTWYSKIADICTHDDFGHPPFRWIYESFDSLYQRGMKIDFLSLVEDLKSREKIEKIKIPDQNLEGISAIEYLYSFSVLEDSLETYAVQCHDYSVKRKVKSLFSKYESLIDSAPTGSELLTNIESEIGKISTYAGVKTKTISDSTDVLSRAISQTEYASKGHAKYIETGILGLDKMIGGFFPQQLITIGGLRGDGKSALAKTIALNISTLNKWKKKVGIFTLEMSNEQYMQRMIGALCGIPPLRLKMGKIYESEWESYEKAIETIRGSKNLYFDDTPHMTSSMLRKKISKMKDLGVDVVVLDQLSLMASEGSRSDAEYSRIDKLSYEFKSFAREFDISFINIQQMSRSIESYQRKDKEPQASDLSNAGDAAPDLIVLIQHQKEKKTILSSKLWIVKQRDGAVGFVDVKFDGERTLFRDLTDEEKKEKVPSILQEELI